MQGSNGEIEKETSATHPPADLASSVKDLHRDICRLPVLRLTSVIRAQRPHVWSQLHDQVKSGIGILHVIPVQEQTGRPMHLPKQLLELDILCCFARSAFATYDPAT